RGFQALEAHLFEKDANLRRAAFESGELRNSLDRLRDGGRRMVSEIGLQRVMMRLELAGGMVKRKPLERLNTTRLILLARSCARCFHRPQRKKQSGDEGRLWPSRAPLPFSFAHEDAGGGTAGNAVL